VHVDASGFSGPLAALFRDIPASLRAPASVLPVPTAEDRGAWQSDAIDVVGVDALLDEARAERGSPWPLPTASAAARVHRDGDRDGWEQVVFARQRRLSRAVVAAARTLDDAWIDEVVDGVWALCEQSSWCWPAHDDAFRVHGSVLADVTDPFLDLGAGEVVGQLAWIDHLLGTALDRRVPGIRARIRHEARVRVIDPFVRRRDWHWLGLDGDVHNWNPWIHGNVLVAALVLLDDPADRALRERVVALVVEGLDRYVAALPADGAIDEGYAYWWNGACRALEALDLLAHATDGAWDAAPRVPALRETVAFPHRMHLGGPWYVNLADGPAHPPVTQPWHSLHRAARAVGDADARAHAAAHRIAGSPAATEHEGLGRLLRGITDTEWLHAATTSAPLPRDVWLPSTQVLLARTAPGTSAGLTVVAKGGHNGEHHNHNDVGSFIVASDGVPVIVDAGRPTYTADTFGPRRYEIWTMQSSWHNVPEIDGTPQRDGADFAASDVHATVDAGRSALELDLSGAYPTPGLHGWRRRVELDRGRDRVTVEDRWSFRDAARPAVIRMLLAGTVRVAPGSATIDPLGGGRRIRLTWPADAEHRIETRRLDDPMLGDVWGDALTRLEIDVASRTELRIAVQQDETSEDPR
jgi:hypothetical protein